MRKLFIEHKKEMILWFLIMFSFIPIMLCIVSPKIFNKTAELINKVVLDSNHNVMRMKWVNFTMWTMVYFFISIICWIVLFVLF